MPSKHSRADMKDELLSNNHELYDYTQYSDTSSHSTIILYREGTYFSNTKGIQSSRQVGILRFQPRDSFFPINGLATR